MEDQHQQDICRVCRSESSPDKPLFHPCVCTGSIRYVHQECLVQWLKYSKKEYCELCKHKFAFKPIYSPDMPKRLPVKDIVSGLVKSLARAVRYWFQSTLVALAWLGIVPLTACRIYRCLFTGSVSSLLTLPLDMLSTENVVADCFQGCFVVTCTLCAFISLVWLREQILHGGGPDWVALDGIANRLPNIGGVGQAGINARGGAVPANQNNAAANDNEAPPVGREEQGIENEAAGNVEPANHENLQAANNENEWNPIEWDRAAEELTWERLLGLDGSLVFLEHVFWVVSLNTLFILVFAFCPYHIGRFAIMGLKIEAHFQVPQFEGLITTLLGYVIIALTLVILHTSASAVKLLKFKRLMGLCYIVVKVSLLIVIEIGFFPLICGVWLDICSLSMFDTTLKDRHASFKLAPGTSLFIHWLVGMVYVFYFASFILLLREVLRPGVLWFLRNLNDPDFNPIHEMIHLPVYRHVRRFLASMVIFGSSVLLMLWAPVRLIRWLFPAFLPYNVMLSSDAPVSELSLELLLLQVVLPALLEQGHTRQWLKGIIRGWCVAMAWCLDLRSYLLGDIPLDENAHEADEPHFDVDLAGAEETDEEPEVVDDVINENAAQPGNEANEVADIADRMIDHIINLVAAEMGAEAQNDADDVNVENDAVVGEQEDAQRMGVINWVNDVIDNAADGLQLQEEAANHDPGVQPVPPVEEQIQVPPAVPAVDVIPPVDVANPVVAGNQQVAVQAGDQGLGAVHQAMLLGGGPTGFQAFIKPSFFPMRVFCLFLMMCLSLFIASTISYIAPVYVGRLLMSLWMKDARVHELYTAACGLYACWLMLRGVTITSHWLPQGWGAIWERIQEWAILGAKSLVVAALLLGLVPLLLGLLFELIVVVPMRVPLDQSPVFFPWQDWALGVLHTKIICAVTMMGPQWRLKQAIEQVYNQGWRNMDLKFVITSLCLPVIGVLGMCICLPYVFAKSIVPVFDLGFDTNNLVLRRIYPSLLCFVLLIAFAIFQVKQFKKLYEHIKNDKYLVGQRLVNYGGHSVKKSSESQALVGAS